MQQFNRQIKVLWHLFGDYFYVDINIYVSAYMTIFWRTAALERKFGLSFLQLFRVLRIVIPELHGMHKFIPVWIEDK
jgi:hypothetical protein